MRDRTPGRSAESWIRTSDSADFTRELYPTELPRRMETVGLEPTILSLQRWSLPHSATSPEFPRMELNHRPAVS